MSGWGLALVVVTALRLGAAAILPATPDEAYYWVWARDLQPGYLDHPPMVALWIAAGTALMGDDPLGIRSLGPLGIALASVALARAGDLLFPESRPGVWGAALLNATPMVNAGAVLMTPDTPLIVFWCLALWAVARLHVSGDGRWWFVVGALAGAALLSKYTALLFGLGLVAWLVAVPAARQWWRDARLYGGGLVAGVVFLPVVLWNATHGWASFAKQGGRAGSGEGLSLRFIGELLGGQLALASPVIFGLAVAGVGVAAAAWARRRGAGTGLVVALTLPAAVVFLWQATGSRVQGNWPAILYPAGCLAAALVGAGWRPWALGVGAAMTLAIAVQASLSPLDLGRSRDPTLARLGGWEALGQDADAARRSAGAAFLASEEYGLASELTLHVPAGVTVVAAGDRWRFFSLPAPVPGQAGLMVRSVRRGEGAPDWPGAVAVGELRRVRDGEEAERYRLYRIETPAGGLPAAVLPRPRPRRGPSGSGRGRGVAGRRRRPGRGFARRHASDATNRPLSRSPGP
ncbi:glycosyltransferase family 39 protein [Muricoccus radiodurans]|uniref:glycosyltransferase family 39 protein n=1 Tax=Muricoccus radiodurans TaxID=2231721 RepID=UPI003CEA0C86